jgi:hypothetical protein
MTIAVVPSTYSIQRPRRGDKHRWYAGITLEYVGTKHRHVVKTVDKMA